MKIHTLNTRDNSYWEILKKHFYLKDKHFYKVINSEYKRMIDVTGKKGINYSALKTMLTPQKNKKEICLVFDSMKIKDSYYGGIVFNQYFPLIKELNNICVFHGDLLMGQGRELQAYELLNSSVNLCNLTIFRYSCQYYLVYINNLNSNNFNNIINSLRKYDNFIGYVDTTFYSKFKDVVSTCLVQSYFIHGNYIVNSNCEDELEDINYLGHDFEEFNKKINSIPETIYLSFLCYKIQRSNFDFDLLDQMFSLNTISSNIESIEDYEIELDENKFDYIKNKLNTLEIKNIQRITRRNLIKLIKEKCNRNYLFNLEYLEEYDVCKFTMNMDLCDIQNSKNVRLIIGLEYKFSEKKLRILTIF